MNNQVSNSVSYVCLCKDKYGRFYLKSSKNKPKSSASILAYVEISPWGYIKNPGKEWKDGILSREHKNYAYSDGYFFTEPPIDILQPESCINFCYGKTIYAKIESSKIHVFE